MYKVTVGNRTFVGCNEDAWRTTSKIWFETATNDHEYGVAFTGSRSVGLNKFAPQSGMNTAGLVYSRLGSFHPKPYTPDLSKKQITDEVTYLSNILHTCATVNEVAAYINQFDHAIFIDDVFIYVDSTGDYLVVEPYNLIFGNDANYVLSNFCPSITEIPQANKLTRYRNGVDFLNQHATDTTVVFLTHLSDTMHVCRNRNGDGTLLTSIWDTKNGLVNLYFYHNYDTTVQFNIQEELAKGNHLINIPDVFPRNKEFERLANYKTPFNTPVLRVLLVIIGGTLTLFAFVFAFASSIGKWSNRISVALLNILLTGYLFVLATNHYIYYFDAPFQHFNSKLISASSYIPFLLLLVVIPITLTTLKQLRTVNCKWLKLLLLSNNLIYIVLSISFAYWGLYSVWV